MGNLSNHITVNIAEQSAGLARAGFGKMLTLSYRADWTERVRSYSSAAEVLADFPLEGGSEYRTALAYFGQANKPEVLKIGRCVNSSVMGYTLVPTAVDSTEYKVTVSGEGMSPTEVVYTSDASATVAEITAGLETLISAVTGNPYAVTDNSTDLVIVGDTAESYFTVKVDPTLIEISMSGTDAGLSTDLAAIQVEDDDWYVLHTTRNSNAQVLAATAWIETQRKAYAFDTNESDAVQTAVGNSDTLDDLKTATRERVIGQYHHDPYEQLSAAIVGYMLPLNPGSATWKFKRLSGPTPSPLTSTQRVNLINRSANFYESISGFNIFSEGTTPDGDYVDVLVGLDWLNDAMQKAVFNVLVNSDKIAYEDHDIAVIENAVRSVMKEAEDRKIIAKGSTVVSAEKVADQPDSDKGSRTYNGISFKGILSGAVHKVAVSGKVVL